MACCSRICCLVFGAICCVVVILISGLIYVITNPLIDSGLEEEFIISSENATRFTYWACKYSLFNEGVCAPPHDSVAFNEAYFFFNITNVDEVLQGGYPRVEEFGPYFYSVDIFKYDIEFVDDGNEVQYGEAKTYFWNASLSCEGCQPTDKFVQINAGYLGAIDTAGSETLLLLGLGGPVIGKMLREIEATYIAYLIERDGYAQTLATCQLIDADCNSTQDMAFVQFGYYEKAILNPDYGLENVGVNEWNSTLFPYPAEYSVVMSGNVLAPENPLNITQLRKLLYGTKGIVEGPLYLIELLQSVVNPEELEETWGLTPSALATFSLYILGLGNTYDLLLYNEVTVLNEGGGLFSQRTVEQWVFNFQDPLLKYLQPRDPQTAIRYNDTSVEDARSYKPGKISIRTGKGDSRQVANVTMWNGTTVINFWNSSVQVAGNNQDGQFFFQGTDGRGKLPERLEDFDIWSPDHGRTIYLEDTGEIVETAVTQIKMRRYLLSNSTYDLNPLYFQDLVGFVNGSFHMDPPFRKRIEFGAKVPLFFSQPRFWAIDTDLVKQIEFINTEPNLLDCATIIDVEPISGNAMGARKRLQVNFYIAPNSTSQYSRFHPNITGGVMYPVLYISQDILITPVLEDEWNSELGIVLDIRSWVFLIGLIIGSIGFVLCIVGLFFASRVESEPRYTSLN